MSTHVVDDSIDFINDERKLKRIIANGFDLDQKCHYEALALKLEFAKLTVKIRQIMSEYKEQEFPDIYEHLRMIRAANETFRNYIMMNVGDTSATEGIHHVGSPKAKSTPTRKCLKINHIPHISIASPKTPDNVGENQIDRTFRENQNSLLTPASRAPHDRTYKAVQNFQNTLNLLQIPRATIRKRLPKFNVSRTYLPRRRMNFSRSYTATPQTK